MMKKEELVTEAAKWVLEWLEKTDPDFKDCSVLVIAVSKGKNSSHVFDMASNEPPDMMFQMLAHGIEQVMTSDPDHVDIATGKPS